MADPRVLWTPPPDVRERTRIGAYLSWLEAKRGLAFAGYDDLHRWSIDDLAGFWSSVWEHFDVRSSTDPGPALADASMPGARWFPDARLNWAEHCLRLAQRRDDDTVLVARSQTRDRQSLTADELREAVARARAGLVRLGVGRGDRVAAYLPNVPEAVIALLATASLGAIWSSCAPEFGTRSVVDRFSQIEPKVLLTIDGYRYGDREVDRSEEVAAIRAALPSLSATVLVPYLQPVDRSHPGRDAMGRSGRPARGARHSNRSRSTIRSSCSTAPAPPGCRSRSSTAMAASCSSTSRSTHCTTISGLPIGSSGSAPPAG